MINKFVQYFLVYLCKGVLSLEPFQANRVSEIGNNANHMTLFDGGARDEIVYLIDESEL